MAISNLRRHLFAKQFLDNFSGHLMVDDYAGYKKLFKENLNMIELDCMVHARRQFFDFYHATESPIAKTALDFFACLYQIEGQAKEANLQEPIEIRQKHAVPVLETLKQWLDEQALVVKSAKLVNAISYTLKR